MYYVYFLTIIYSSIHFQRIQKAYSVQFDPSQTAISISSSGLKHFLSLTLDETSDLLIHRTFPFDFRVFAISVRSMALA